MASSAAFVNDFPEARFALYSFKTEADGKITRSVRYVPRGPVQPVVERKWTEPSPIGHYFNAVANGEIYYYGRVYGESSFGTFDCQLFDINTDEEFDAKVPVSIMRDWLWYKSEDDMWDGQGIFVPPPIPEVVPALVTPEVLTSVKLPKAPPAPLGPAAFHGILGDFVRLVEPSTEGDINALVVAFLTTIGSFFGRQPHHYVEDTRHGTNLYSVIVGESAKARKGTITGRSMNLLKMTDKEFFEKRVHKGLSSGEGLVYAIRDAREDPKPVTAPGDPQPVAQKGKPSIADPGVADKRLLVVESEFGSVLQQGKRDGNILSEVMRNGWDSTALGSMAKTNQDRCMEPHVSLIGNITVDELQRCLSEKDRANGFGNRILWVYAKRSKILPCPERVPEKDLQIIADRINGVQFRMPGEMKWSESAKPLWYAEYARLSAEGTGDGLVDALTARAEAQVLRIAMIYAVLDSSSFIERVHLEAALEVWRYCEESAKFIFGGATGNRLAEETLSLLLAKPEGMTQTELSDAFNRKKTAAQLKDALDILLRLGKVRSEERASKTKPVVVWVAI